MADFEVHNHGSVLRIVPLNDDAEQWVEDHVFVPDYAWSNGGFYADHRPGWDLVQGLEAEGFSVRAA